MPSLWQRLKDAQNECASECTSMRDFDVYRSELIYPDYVGRLVEKTPSGGGVKRWCILSDLLFCIFESECSDKAIKAILLPGSSVKSLIFRTTSFYSVKNKRNSKSLEDLDMFQFVIENEAFGEKFKFSTTNQVDLDKWVSLLKIATCLDPAITMHSNIVNGDETCKFSEGIFEAPLGCYGDLSQKEYQNERIGSGVYSEPFLNGKENFQNFFGEMDYGCTCYNHSFLPTLPGMRLDMGDNSRIIKHIKELDDTDISSKPQLQLLQSSTAKKMFGNMVEGDNVFSEVDSCSYNQLTSNYASINEDSETQQVHCKLKRVSDMVTRSPQIEQQASPEMSSTRDMELSEYVYYKVSGNWSKVFCILRECSCTVWKTSDMSQAPIVFLDLHGCTVSLVDDEKQVGSAFKVMLPNRYEFCFAPPNNLDMERWLSVLHHNGCEITDVSEFRASTRSRIRNNILTTAGCFYTELTRADSCVESETVEAFCTAPRRRNKSQVKKSDVSLPISETRNRKLSETSEEGMLEPCNLNNAQERRFRKMSEASSTSCEVSCFSSDSN